MDEAGAGRPSCLDVGACYLLRHSNERQHIREEIQRLRTPLLEMLHCLGSPSSNAG